MIQDAGQVVSVRPDPEGLVAVLGRSTPATAGSSEGGDCGDGGDGEA
jgi:hypothetical protein